MSAFDLWFHDGSGFGWPALETSRQELPQPDRTTKILRNLIVFSGGEKNLAGLSEGVNIRLSVPEGLPTEGDTCSHHQEQPGSEAHRTSVLHGLDGEAYVDRAIEHGYIAAEDREKALTIRRDGLSLSFEGSPRIPA